MKTNRGGLPKFLCYFCLIIVLCLGLISIIGSGGGGGGGTATTDTTTDGDGDTGDGDTGGDGTTTPPAFSGFDFTLSEGDFWEYSWDYSYSYTGYGSTTSENDSGTFRVTLGSTKEIDGITAYEVEVTGKSQVDSTDLAPRWDYLALADNKLLGSDDGTTLTTIFDAQEGVWPGSGFFTSFSSEDLFTATEGTINNDYISETAISVGQSSSSSQCEYFPGVGTICGGDYNENDSKTEYYKGNIGPIGYHKYFSMSDMTSTFDWWSTTTEINLGLVASSLQGDTADYDFEAEPNDSPTAAQAMTPSRDIHGYCGDEDSGTVMTLNEISEAESNDHPQQTAQSLNQATMVDGSINDGDSSSIIDFYYYGDNYQRAVEDWYTFTLTSAATVNVELNHEGPVSTQIQLYLFNDTGSTSMGNVLALDEEADPTTTTRSITAALGSETYLIAVDAWDTDAANVDYTLDFLGATREMEDFYSFTLNAQTAVTITMNIANTSADLDLYLYNENGTTLLESSIAGGAQESITTTIGPETYVIGVDAFDGSSNYTLAVETS